MYQYSGEFRGGATAPPPKKKKFVHYGLFLGPFCIRMLTNLAEVARESIKTPETFQARALKRPLDSGRIYRDFGFCVRDVRART